MFRRPLMLCFACALAVSIAAPAHAVTNPDLSVLGQPFARWTTDPADPSRRRATLDPGEVEMVFDAYLNPYAKGFVVGAIGDEGLELEEGYFTLLRGLPGDLQVKGGKYRVGFGKLNALHPHAIPFAERPRVLAAFLPGEEAFVETGLSLSERIPLPGTFSLTASADWLQGDQFRVPRASSGDPGDPLEADPESGDRADEARPAFVGALSGFGALGERSGWEIGLSGTGGTNNVAAGTRTLAWDAAAKAKLWTGPNAYLLLQGEALWLDREDATWDPAAGAYVTTRVRPWGAFAFADYAFDPRWDAGVFYERYQQPTGDRPWDQAVGAFAGLALMEETTSFRLDWNHFTPGTSRGAPDAPDVDTVTLRVIFSMGPHKAHIF